MESWIYIDLKQKKNADVAKEGLEDESSTQEEREEILINVRNDCFNKEAIRDDLESEIDAFQKYLFGKEENLKKKLFLASRFFFHDESIFVYKYSETGFTFNGQKIGEIYSKYLQQDVKKEIEKIKKEEDYFDLYKKVFYRNFQHLIAQYLGHFYYEIFHLSQEVMNAFGKEITSWQESERELNTPMLDKVVQEVKGIFYNENKMKNIFKNSDTLKYKGHDLTVSFDTQEEEERIKKEIWETIEKDIRKQIRYYGLS